MEDRFTCISKQFLEKETETNVNFSFWWQYMEMVSTMLFFTRAQHDGIWDLHLASFRQMIPFFTRYDHYNYARWGPIYLFDTDQLPENLKCEFMRGDFVVKCSAHSLNQVDPDQAQE